MILQKTTSEYLENKSWKDNSSVFVLELELT